MTTWNNGPLRNEAGDSPEGGAATLGSEPSAEAGSPTPSLGGDPSGAAPTGDWRDHLSVSDEVKNWGGYDNIKDPSDAITQLYNAQKMMGSEKIEKPQESWTEDQWTAHYRALGAPESAENYNIETPEALAGIVTEDQVTASKELYQKAGLTQQQVDILNSGSNEFAVQRHQAMEEARQSKIDADMRNLQVEWGDDFNAKFDVAKAAVRKIGGDDLVKALNDTGAAQHPAFIKAFAEAGQHYMESSGGKGPLSTGMIVSNQTQASQLLKERNRDPEWTTALMDKDHPAHDDVVRERAELFAMAHPS